MRAFLAGALTALVFGVCACAGSPETTRDAGVDLDVCASSCDTSPRVWPPLTISQVGAPMLVSADFRFAEGPVWDGARTRLLFSDIDADTIYALTLPSTVGVVTSPSRRANGLALDRSGRRLAAEHGSRSVTRTGLDGAVETLAERFEGRRLNSPNDLVLRADGTVYFTDPTYGLGATPSELGFTGLYRISPAGALSLEARVEGAPNGVALAPEEDTLYVAATVAGRVLAFDVSTSGATSNPRTFASVDAPDGLAVDAGGNLYVAALDGGRGDVVVLDREGHRLGAIALDHQPTNCAFGGADGRTLFVTARQALYRVAVPIPGLSTKGPM